MSLHNTRICQRLLTKHPLLLDGGLSNQLEAQGFDLNHELWSAKILLEQPQAVIDAHKYYLQAGAQCLITASYQASVSGLLKFGLTSNEAVQLIKSSVNVAEQAISEFKLTQPNSDELFIAASIGPYGASLADGSEYHGNYGVTDDVLHSHHQQQLDILATTNSDILACETIPSLQEALVLRDLLQNYNKPAWLSFSCRNGQQLNDGTPIEDCIRAFNKFENPIALGVNCTNPKFIAELISRIKSVSTGQFIIVYPNSGEEYDANSKQWFGTSSPSECGHAAKDWLKAGANIIGGCCRMGPEHIEQIKAQLK